MVLASQTWSRLSFPLVPILDQLPHPIPLPLVGKKLLTQDQCLEATCTQEHGLHYPFGVQKLKTINLIGY